MKEEISRRTFIQLTGIGTASVIAGSTQGISAADDKKAVTSPAGKAIPFQLGLCSFTFRNFKVDDVIEMTTKTGIKYISLKDMHLSLNSKTDVIKATIDKFNKAGITVYAGGVVYMKTREEISRAFDYARDAGMKILVAVPPHELLDVVHEKVKEYDIKIAIHNHGPGDKLYPTSDVAYEKIKNMDKRMGLCMDIGHTQRAGQNPAEQIEKYADRMLDFHIKDVTEASAKGTATEVGKGVIDIPSVIKALVKINYSGIAAFEYEKDGKAPMPGLTESIKYVRDILSKLA